MVYSRFATVDVFLNSLKVMSIGSRYRNALTGPGKIESSGPYDRMYCIIQTHRPFAFKICASRRWSYPPPMSIVHVDLLNIYRK